MIKYSCQEKKRQHKRREEKRREEKRREEKRREEKTNSFERPKKKFWVLQIILKFVLNLL